MRPVNLTLAQTGRTTRLRERAVELASQGRAVYILVLRKDMVKLEAERIDELWNWLGLGPKRLHGIKVEAFDVHWQEKWNWARMEPLGNHHENCAFLMDHSVVEMKLDFVRKQITDLATLAGHLYPYTT